MQRDLSRKEVEAWIVRLELDNDGKPDWKRVASKAGLGETQGYVVSSRWGTNRFQMQKVIAFLQRLEDKRKEPTETGALVAMLDDWNRIGRELANEPERLKKEIERLAPIAAVAQQKADAKETIARADKVLLSPFPEPGKPRK